ncbi:hypothetical protein DIPPA_21562 [Diplonema papillatum]|nr:hypothetical protein DIPPA_21562 [Diplonema papillatum]
MPHFEHAPQVKLEPQDRIAVAVGDSFKRPSATALLASVPDEVADDAVNVEDVVITGDTFDAVLTRSNSVQTTEVSGTLAHSKSFARELAGKRDPAFTPHKNLSG